jgi:hypothetical protein
LTTEQSEEVNHGQLYENSSNPSWNHAQIVLC